MGGSDRDLTTGRYAQIATLLGDSTILVARGREKSHLWKAVYQFDPCRCDENLQRGYG